MSSHRGPEAKRLRDQLVERSRHLRPDGKPCSERSRTTNVVLEVAHIDHNPTRPDYNHPRNARLLTLLEHYQDHLARHGKNGLSVNDNFLACYALRERLWLTETIGLPYKQMYDLQAWWSDAWMYPHDHSLYRSEYCFLIEQGVAPELADRIQRERPVNHERVVRDLELKLHMSCPPTLPIHCYPFECR